MTAGDDATKSDPSKAPARIERMFDGIAGRYDFLNHLLSAGLDRRWRRRAIRSLRLTGPELVLDLCTGTADLAIAAARGRPAAARVVGLDFASAMLEVGRGKLRREGLSDRVTLVRGDATRIPLGDESVDAVTIAFGIRNVADMPAAAREIYRVLKPGGRLAILEFARPTIPGVSAIYFGYLNHLLPRIGRAVSRQQGAYDYLAASIARFVPPEEFVKMLRQATFCAVSAVRLTLGTVILYEARKLGGPV